MVKGTRTIGFEKANSKDSKMRYNPNSWRFKINQREVNLVQFTDHWAAQQSATPPLGDLILLAAEDTYMVHIYIFKHIQIHIKQIFESIRGWHGESIQEEILI